MGSASMRATLGGRLIIKAAEAAALKSGKEAGGGTELEGNHQAGGRHRGMGEFVDLEAGQFKIGNLIHESAILSAQGNMFGHGHIEATAINEGPSGLHFIYESPT
jgi:hypothetical protein